MTSWCVIVPVKRLDRAKTRLHLERSGTTAPDRAAVALAFASDVVAAALDAAEVAHVIVVTDDPLAATTLGALGAVIVPDSPDAGINPALVHGRNESVARWPDLAVAALSSDVPCARPIDIDVALTQAATTSTTSFVADSSGIGTTMYLAPDAADFAPAFGRRSRAAHRAGGAVEIDAPGLARLRRDVDTAVDLWDAERLGTGAHTAAALA